MPKVLALALGSLAGGFGRYYMSGAVQRMLAGAFPYGTLAVNLTGCFLIGVVASIPDEKLWGGHAGRLFLTAGFCGAFTTFSTWTLETAVLFREGEAARAAANVAAGVMVGFAAFWLGSLLGQKLS